MACRIVNENRAEICRMDWRHMPPSGRPLPVQPLYGAAEAEAAGEDGPDTETLRREAEQAAREAYERGRREGEDAGRQAAEERLAGRFEHLARVAEGLATYRPRLRREAEADLVRLSLAIARRVLRRELSVDPAAVLGIVKAAIDRIEVSEIHRIRLHPEHAEVLSQAAASWPHRVEILPDRRLALGGVVFETARGGAVDASLDAQLMEIERGFTDLLPK